MTWTLSYMPHLSHVTLPITLKPNNNSQPWREQDDKHYPSICRHRVGSIDHQLKRTGREGKSRGVKTQLHWHHEKLRKIYKIFFSRIFLLLSVLFFSVKLLFSRCFVQSFHLQQRSRIDEAPLFVFSCLFFFFPYSVYFSFFFYIKLKTNTYL